MNNEQIIQTKAGEQSAAPSQQQPSAYPTPYIFRRWPSMVAGSVLIALAGGGTCWLWVASKAIVDVAASLTFFAQNTLSLFIFLGVVAQALIYMGQRKLMYEQWLIMQDTLKIERAKLAPRLRISKVQVKGFEVGKTPVFVVWIANAGLTDARGVVLSITVQVDPGEIIEWSRKQIVTIPANGEQPYFVHWKQPIHRDDIWRYGTEATRLEVLGFFEYESRHTDFCYRYYGWTTEDRPEGVAEFVPCDFNPGLTTAVTPEPAQLKITTFAPEIFIGGKSDTESKDKEENPE